MKAINLLLISAVAGGLYYFSQAKKFASTYQLDFGNPRFNKSATAGKMYTVIYFDLPMVLTNPTTFSGVLNALKVDVTFSGRKLGQIVKTSAVNLKANGPTRFDLTVGINTGSLFKNVQEAIAFLKNNSSLKLNLKGVALTNAGDIPIDTEVKIV